MTSPRPCRSAPCARSRVKHGRSPQPTLTASCPKPRSVAAVHMASRARRAPARLFLLLLLCLLSSAASAAPRIGVATMQPGEIFFERFGHNAIVVDDPAAAEPISYNFGYFDMDEPGFTANFI